MIMAWRTTPSSFVREDKVAHEAGSHGFTGKFAGSGSMGMVATSDSVSTFPQYVSYSGEFVDYRVSKGKGNK